MHGLAVAVAALVLAGVLAGCTSPDASTGMAPPSASPPEAATGAGRLTAIEPQTIKVPLKSAHGRLAVRVEMTTNLPADNLVINVSGPGGRSAQASVSPELYVLPANAPELAFDVPVAGDWTIRLSLSSGATADYSLAWCADDSAQPGPRDNKACQHAY